MEVTGVTAIGKYAVGDMTGDEFRRCLESGLCFTFRDGRRLDLTRENMYTLTEAYAYGVFTVRYEGHHNAKEMRRMYARARDSSPAELYPALRHILMLDHNTTDE